VFLRKEVFVLLELGHGIVSFLYLIFNLKNKIQMDQEAMSVLTVLIF
jgi:hypothetical protein